MLRKAVIGISDIMERVKLMPANRNKKAEKAFHTKARRIWSRKPITRVVANGKAYNRKKDKKEFHRTLTEGDDGILDLSKKSYKIIDGCYHI